jgi:hypothetical protein
MPRTNARLIMLALAVLSTAAESQVISGAQNVTLSASKGQVVSLGTPSPTNQALTIIDNQVNTYSAPFSITVSWDVTNSAVTTVKLVGYFANPAQALANGTSYIPSSLIETSTDGGTTWTPVTGAAVGTVGIAGGSVVLYTSPVTQGANHSGTQSVTFQVRLNLVGAPTTVAGTYTGTLLMMAICS